MLTNNKQLTISTAGSRTAKNWPASTIWWSELLDRLKTPVRGTETLAEYLALSKAQQDELKDVGGFVGGALKDNRRKAANVLSRDLVTLDLDNLPVGSTGSVIQRLEGLGCAYAIYSTRKHEEGRPRLRILVPLNRPATADEYAPIARYLGGLMGIECCDPISFQGQSLMYWPSCCKDSQYVYYFADKGFLMADSVLAQYQDWRNVAEWPEVPGAQKQLKTAAVKQHNPLDKSGPVGAFCKTYNIYQAIDTFLPGIYTPCDNMPDRFTYTGGSTTGGAVIYDDGAFLYSHHATDPAGGRLVNSFDLVRLHLYGDQDDDAVPGTPTNRLPSYTAMCQLAVGDQAVAGLLNQERYEQAMAEFGAEPPAVNDTEWTRLLAVAPTSGLPAKTIDNCLIILENDPQLKGKLAFDEFAERGMVLSPLPWNPHEGRRDWKEHDDDGLSWYMEKFHSITGKDRILTATSLCARKNSFNDVTKYLTGLKWDGVHRLDTLFIDYLGAKDTPYTRAVSRKSFTAAVARAMKPGTKYDYMPILCGPQGIGKSTLLRLMGKRWYSDSLQTFEGKDAAEMLRGVWVNEVGELAGLSKAEINAVKQFLSRTEDIYREAYGRRTGVYPRRCVFFGTTNDTEFLKDRTGNRRFWPVNVGVSKPTKNVFEQLAGEVDQLWAEAFCYWQLGESLYLTGAVEEEAKQEQDLHKEVSIREGLIREFVERPVPVDWDKRTMGERKLYWSGEFSRDGAITEETRERDRICAAEVWCECLGGEPKFMRQTDTREINTILENLPGWTKALNGLRFGKTYGLQRGYIKVN
jgi:putative DNA primase/helicase